MTSDDYNLIGNIIGFFVLGGKSLYDIFINPAQHKNDLKKGCTAIDAAQKKRERADWSIAITFGLLACSYIFFFFSYYSS